MPFTRALSYFSKSFQPRQARKHNKLGVLERNNSIMIIFIKHLLMDAEYFSKRRGKLVSSQESLPMAMYLSDIMYGGRLCSSFQLVQGYAPRINNLPRIHITSELIETHKKQVVWRSPARYSSFSEYEDPRNRHTREVESWRRTIHLQAWREEWPRPLGASLYQEYEAWNDIYLYAQEP